MGKCEIIWIQGSASPIQKLGVVGCNEPSLILCHSSVKYEGREGPKNAEFLSIIFLNQRDLTGMTVISNLGISSVSITKAMFDWQQVVKVEY